MSRGPTTLAELDKISVTTPGEHEADYYESLGRFITAYASAEAAVHELTRWVSKLSEAKARGIFAGMRLGDLTDRIRAMLRTDKADPALYAEIDTCLIQLDLIGDERNKLVHRSVSFVDGKLSVTNAYTAKTKDGIEFHTFSRTDLDNMKWDCDCIFWRLIKIVHPFFGSIPDAMVEFVMRSWRYKPAQPKTPKKPRQKGPAKRPPRPAASPT